MQQGQSLIVVDLTLASIVGQLFDQDRCVEVLGFDHLLLTDIDQVDFVFLRVVSFGIRGACHFGNLIRRWLTFGGRVVDLDRGGGRTTLAPEKREHQGQQGER